MENISGIDTVSLNALRATVARGYGELFDTLAPIAKAYHTYISQDMPQISSLPVSPNIRDDRQQIIPFHEFELDVLDPTEGHFAYTCPDLGAFFMVPHEYAENPEAFVAGETALIEKAYETVNKVYAEFAPRVAKELPEMTPYIRSIDKNEGTAHVYITEGDNKGITLCHPAKDILKATVLTVDLNTGEIIYSRMM